jgi:hypothetical protein
MSQPIVVSLPHRLGKAEALRRLQTSFNDAQSKGGAFFTFRNQWSGDHLDFRASLLGQTTTGIVDVAEDHVRHRKPRRQVSETYAGRMERLPLRADQT